MSLAEYLIKFSSYTLNLFYYVLPNILVYKIIQNTLLIYKKVDLTIVLRNPLNKQMSKKIQVIDHSELLKSVRQCQQRSKKVIYDSKAQTLQSVDNTLIGVRQTLKDIKQTNDNIDQIKRQYSQVMDKLAAQVVNSMTGMSDQPFKKKLNVIYEEQATDQLSEKEVAEQIMYHQDILILTGAGVSAPSGIPTFRGKSGLYAKNFLSKKTGEQIPAEQFITQMFYKQQPQSIWQWVDQIYKLSSHSKSNRIHAEVHQLALKLSNMGKKVVVATQNIDDLHIKPQLKEYQYYNIHGNCKQVRCKNHHFFRYQNFVNKGFNFKQKPVQCETCGQQLRPHLLFFDETYGKNYGQQIKNRQFPLVIVIGSSVRTGLAIKLIREAEQIIQINPQPVIQIGNVYTFRAQADKVLEKIKNSLE